MVNTDIGLFTGRKPRIIWLFVMSTILSIMSYLAIVPKEKLAHPIIQVIVVLMLVLCMWILAKELQEYSEEIK